VETRVSTAEDRTRQADVADVGSASADDAADALITALQHGAHYLPSQGPIETFIHHNTLHAFEDLEFHTALAASAKIVGASSYLSEREFRDAHAHGRITDRDLNDAIALRQVPVAEGADRDDPFTNRAAIFRACLLHDLDPEPIPRIRWRFSENRALTEPGDEARWPACLDAVRRIGRGDAPDLRGEAAAVLASLGERTHRDIALAMTSIDIAQAVDRWMVRDVASHLDEGIAIDAHPHRRVGLFEGWRASKRAGTRYLAGLPADLALPEDPVAASLLALDRLGVPIDRYGAYITRLLQHLPGWAGMIHWRETHPEYRPELPPVALVDFVAIRLLGEWSELSRLARATWGCEAREMIEHLQRHPEEATLRHALFDGRLMERSARHARKVLLRRPDRREVDARRIVEAAMCVDDGPEIGRAWQLARLTRVLGIHGDELRCTPLPRVAALLETLDELGPAVRLPVWQEAYEKHYRDQILEALHDNRAHRPTRTSRASFQVVTCIDDREEGFRRHLEEIDPTCETFGTGGFFGVPIAFLGRDHTEFSSLCPLGVQPMHRVLEVPTDDRPARARRFDRGHVAMRRWRGHWREILGHGWASILGAYTAGFFAWMWLVGELVFPRQFDRVRRRIERVMLPEHATELVSDEHVDTSHAIAGFSLREQVERVSGTLQNLGLVRDFARLVVVLGHGSGSRNNPHLSAYDCGACGGRHGGPNARLFCSMANAPAVRAGLRGMGIDIPDDTWFQGGEHNTCNEDIAWSDIAKLPAARATDFARVAAALDRARAMSAHERCRKLEHAPPNCTPDQALRHVQERSLDPSQVRPELNHVTNAVAVFGRRRLTRGVFFDRRMFLVSYDPTIDAGGAILERLLMAMGPVGAGINLEYYFSRVDVQRYGAGTKLPHNVVGLIGVMDGWSSDLRTGLPQQMVEIHEPMRLLLVIESTPKLVGDILARQPVLRTLVDNGWVRVALVDPDDGTTRNYVPGIGLVDWHSRNHELPVVLDSAAWYRGTLDFLPPARIETLTRIADRREVTP
jgi:uncharacterized protein YbcC (UPF0753/DUF2309 family)